MKAGSSSSLTGGVVDLIFLLSAVNSCFGCQEKVLECHWGRCAVKASFLGAQSLAERRQIPSQRSGIVVLRHNTRDRQQTLSVHCGLSQYLCDKWC